MSSPVAHMGFGSAEARCGHKSLKRRDFRDAHSNAGGRD